jgi:chromosome segregation ATPase
MAIQRLPAGVMETPADEHVQVNLELLDSRIEGINLSLHTLEADLNEKRDYTADRLDALLSRLDILVLRQKDLTLIRDLITPQQQAKVGQIDSARSAIATMGTRIAQLRSRLRDNEALPGAERSAALKRLDELSDRLATITTEK